MQDSVSFIEDPRSDQKASSVSFLEVYYAEDMSMLIADGLVGLAPLAPPDYTIKTLMSEWHDQGVIEDNVFSIYMAHNHESEESVIWFGGYDYNTIRQALLDSQNELGETADVVNTLSDEDLAKQIMWVDINNLFYW